MKKFTFLMSFVFAVMLSSGVIAQTVLFSEDFEDQNAASRFTKIELGGSNEVNMALPYGANTPAAPTKGNKYCLKIAVNTTDGEASMVGFFPKGLKLTGTYTLTFNAWLNWKGDGSTTEFLYYGVGHNDTVSAPPADGCDFAFTGDNGSSRDRRLYKDGKEVSDLSLYTAGTQNQDIFYNNCLKDNDGDESTPAVPGNQWLNVTAQVTDTGVLYKVGNIAMHDTVFAYFKKDVLPVDGHVLIGYYDMFSSIGDESVYVLIDNIKITTGGTTGIGKFKSENIVSLYPNPAKDNLHLAVKTPSTFELYNIEGRLVKRQKVERTATINVSDLVKGLYIVKVTDNKGFIQAQKIVIR